MLWTLQLSHLTWIECWKKNTLALFLGAHIFHWKLLRLLGTRLRTTGLDVCSRIGKAICNLRALLRSPSSGRKSTKQHASWTGCSPVCILGVGAFITFASYDNIPRDSSSGVCDLTDTYCKASLTSYSVQISVSPCRLTEGSARS